MKDFVKGLIGGVIVVAITVLPFCVPFWLVLSLRISTSEQLVSGIVYNNSNNAWISGNTNFSVRAAEDTYTNESNLSSYCLPPNSPYIEIVNEAAADKDVKVVVTTKKMFKLVDHPLVCADNVTVAEKK